jgi:hypothetical protein
MHSFSSINAAFALRPQHAAAGAVEEEEAEEEAEEELHARNRCPPRRHHKVLREYIKNMTKSTKVEGFLNF